MAAPWVLEHLDIIEHIAPGSFPGWIDSPLDPFTLEELEEAFCHGVVVSVSPTAHASLQVIGLQKALPVRATELAALVRMYHDNPLGFPPPDG